jgi:hypothetical protein
MEKLLGVQENEQSEKNLQDDVVDSSRLDVNEADALDQEGRRQARQRYQRMYWESIPEGGSVRLHTTALI